MTTKPVYWDSSNKLYQLSTILNLEPGVWHWPPTSIYCWGWRKSRATNLLPLWAFMAYYRKTFTFTSTEFWAQNKFRKQFVLTGKILHLAPFKTRNFFLILHLQILLAVMTWHDITEDSVLKLPQLSQLFQHLNTLQAVTRPLAIWTL